MGDPETIHRWVHQGVPRHHASSQWLCTVQGLREIQIPERLEGMLTIDNSPRISENLQQLSHRRGKSSVLRVHSQSSTPRHPGSAMTPPAFPPGMRKATQAEMSKVTNREAMGLLHQGIGVHGKTNMHTQQSWQVSGTLTPGKSQRDR